MKIEHFIAVALLTTCVSGCNTNKTETATTTTAPEKSPAKTSTTKKSTTKKSSTDTTKKETTAKHPINSGTKGGPPSEMAATPSPTP